MPLSFSIQNTKCISFEILTLQKKKKKKKTENLQPDTTIQKPSTPLNDRFCQVPLLTFLLI